MLGESSILLLFLESLIETLERVDFAVIVFTPDDFTISRKKKSPSPRDNTLFELGLFMGHLGRERCAFVFDRTAEIRLPTDLLGIAAATYRPHSSGNLQAALGPACTEMKRRIVSVGRRPKLMQLNPQEIKPKGIPDLSGTWAGYSPDGPRPTERNSTLEVQQRGSFVRGTVTTEVKEGVRVFEYEGRFTSGQVVLFFEEDRGRGFIVGTVVLYLSGDLRTLVGNSTYYHHSKKLVVSTTSRYERII